MGQKNLNEYSKETGMYVNKKFIIWYENSKLNSNLPVENISILCDRSETGTRKEFIKVIKRTKNQNLASAFLLNFFEKSI